MNHSCRLIQENPCGAAREPGPQPGPSREARSSYSVPGLGPWGPTQCSDCAVTHSSEMGLKRERLPPSSRVSEPLYSWLAEGPCFSSPLPFGLLTLSEMLNLSSCSEGPGDIQLYFSIQGLHFYGFSLTFDVLLADFCDRRGQDF